MEPKEDPLVAYYAKMPPEQLDRHIFWLTTVPALIVGVPLGLGVLWLLVQFVKWSWG
jgi:ABC-type Fe3+ transport system permease subunit